MHDILDVAYLMMIDEGVTVAQGKAIAAALRIHIRACLTRWRKRFDGIRASQQKLRERLAEIDAEVEPVMSSDEYPDEPDPEPEPVKPGTIPVKNSFFRRVR